MSSVILSKNYFGCIYLKESCHLSWNADTSKYNLAKFLKDIHSFEDNLNNLNNHGLLAPTPAHSMYSINAKLDSI